MNRKRLGQFLIGGILTMCVAVITALTDLVAEEENKRKADRAEESAEEKR